MEIFMMQVGTDSEDLCIISHTYEFTLVYISMGLVSTKDVL